MYLLIEIEEMLFISKSKIKYIIEKMGIVPVKRGSQNQVYYSAEQVELIKENNPAYYTENLIYKNPFIVNYETKN